jgi:hypothetical protein
MEQCFQDASEEEVEDRPCPSYEDYTDVYEGLRIDKGVIRGRSEESHVAREDVRALVNEWNGARWAQVMVMALVPADELDILTSSH